MGLALGLVACKSETPINGPGTGPQVLGTPNIGNSQTSLVSSINAEVYLKIERQLQSPPDAAKATVGICKVPMGSPRGTVVTCNPSFGGDFSIPEGDLHYSKITFTSGTADAAQCPYLIFQPYYYVGSVSAGFVPSWNYTIPADPIDCRPSKATAACFNGAATAMVPGFPATKGFIFLTNFVHESVNTLDSGFNKNQVSNRFTMNANSAWNSPFTDPSDSSGYQSFVGDTAAAACSGAGTSCQAGHRDYSVECRDHDYDLIYGVVVVMEDENTITGGLTLDDFHTWHP